MRDLVAENILMMVVKRTSDTTGTLHTYNTQSPNVYTTISEDDNLGEIVNSMLYFRFEGTPVVLEPMSSSDFVCQLEVGDLAFYALELNERKIVEMFNLEDLFSYLDISRDEVGQVIEQNGNPLLKAPDFLRGYSDFVCCVKK